MFYPSVIIDQDKSVLNDQTTMQTLVDEVNYIFQQNIYFYYMKIYRKTIILSTPS